MDYAKRVTRDCVTYKSRKKKQRNWMPLIICVWLSGTNMTIWTTSILWTTTRLEENVNTGVPHFRASPVKGQTGLQIQGPKVLGIDCMLRRTIMHWLPRLDWTTHEFIDCHNWTGLRMFSSYPRHRISWQVQQSVTKTQWCRPTWKAEAGMPKPSCRRLFVFVS